MAKFIEIREFGFNAGTLSFLSTVVFTLIQSYSLFSQNSKIIRNKSGESVSFVFFSFYTFSAISFLIYGFYKDSLAMIINGLLGFVAVPIVINLIKYKQIKKLEIYLGSLATLLIPAIIYFNEKDFVLLIMGIIVLFAISHQVVELWIKKRYWIRPPCTSYN